jgi:hypothetical protein
MPFAPCKLEAPLPVLFTTPSDNQWISRSLVTHLHPLLTACNAFSTLQRQAATLSISFFGKSRDKSWVSSWWQQKNGGRYKLWRLWKRLINWLVTDLDGAHVLCRSEMQEQSRKMSWFVILPISERWLQLSHRDLCQSYFIQNSYNVFQSCDRVFTWKRYQDQAYNISTGAGQSPDESLVLLDMLSIFKCCAETRRPHNTDARFVDPISNSKLSKSYYFVRLQLQIC